MNLIYHLVKGEREGVVTAFTRDAMTLCGIPQYCVERNQMFSLLTTRFVNEATCLNCKRTRAYKERIAEYVCEK